MISLILPYITVVMVSYFVGSSNLAYFISLSRGVNMRAVGSGNLGASNALIAFGWPAAVAVCLHDIGKAVLAVIIAGYVFPGFPLIGAAAGVACVLGHIFPFYLRFKGGKGFAAYLGMTIALNWKFAIIVLLLVGLITIITDYIVAGTVTTMVLVPAYLGISGRSLALAGVLCVASVIILVLHRENYIRIWKGTEIGFRKASGKKNKE